MATNTKRAGRINGNPLCGLCERVCIETKKVFDGCSYRISDTNFFVTLTSFSTVAPSYTFIEARSSGFTAVNNLVISPEVDGKNRATFIASVPITVYYIDANGVNGTANGVINIPRSVNLRLPSDALSPYEIEVATGLYANLGQFTSPSTVSISVCARQIVKVTATVQLLVPSYGYCEYPECSDDGQSCLGALERPLFPE